MNKIINVYDFEYLNYVRNDIQIILHLELKNEFDGELIEELNNN